MIIITCCSVVPIEIIMHDAYIGGRSENNIWRAACSRQEYEEFAQYTNQIMEFAWFLKKNGYYKTR